MTFTPALERFARESTVFERAFTRYGATGLSVPSLWVGGLVLHKQYVTPFAPMNTLARLLEHEQYAQWISMDNILDVILPPSARRAPLDADVQVADFRLCRTLGEIRGRLDRLKAGGPPAFVYSLPQDVHVAAITREGAAPVDGASYGAFYAPYASRVRRLDACFGEFIDDLKSRGLFDQSLIVVTADHGDSLGEQGRMGHAYTIFPEILQVPLIVHLPSAWAGLRADPSAPAFTTDLTPTLYALLGHEPRPPAAFFGRPLFRRGGRSGAAAIDGSAGGRVELWERVRNPARRRASPVHLRRHRPARVRVRAGWHGRGPHDGDHRGGPRARSARHSRDRRGHCAIESLSPMNNLRWLQAGGFAQDNRPDGGSLIPVSRVLYHQNLKPNAFDQP